MNVGMKHSNQKDEGQILAGEKGRFIDWMTPHGTPADSIVFYVSFNDDEPGNKYKVSGIRYSGLTQDD